MNLEILSVSKKSTKSLDVSENVFDCPYNETLLHEVITSLRINDRQGTVSQKSRSDARGGGAKPWRQKGTGRARAGTRRSPLWRGGGVTFAASPKDHDRKINKKVYKKALVVSLSELRRTNRLVVVDNLELTEPKTKKMIEVLEKLNLFGKKVLILVDTINTNLLLAARNIPYITVLHAKQINPVLLASYEFTCLTEKAVKQIEEKLQ